MSNRTLQVLCGLSLLGVVVTASMPFVYAQGPSAPQADARADVESVPAKNSKVDPDVMTLDGQAVLYGHALRKRLKLELVDDSLDKVVAYETKDGRLIPILPTEAGLFFLRDERVRNKPMRIAARLHENESALEVITFHSLVDGKPNEIYYWCEICSIQMYHLKDCDCCQGPIELREHPVGETFRLKGK
ncbi:hypothetical protein K2Y11_05355 [bacterium]|nr:hypothetical protein [bacterium]